MPVDPQAKLQITAFDWVPDFAQGHVRDLRPRWACEEIGLSYSVRLISAVERPDFYYGEQPWGQVPVIHDGDATLFESGAILLHLGAKDARLLPVDPVARERVNCWLFAAYNSVEPWGMALADVEIFSKDEEWAKLRRPGLLKQIGERLDRLQTALGDREWLTDQFSVADIAMVTVLRDFIEAGLLETRPALAAYVDRGMARPAFKAAIAAQLADFRDQPKAA